MPTSNVSSGEDDIVSVMEKAKVDVQWTSWVLTAWHVPMLLTTSGIILCASVDSIQHENISIIWILPPIFFLTGVVFYAYGIRTGWQRPLAAICLSYIFLTFWIVHYRTAINDFGCLWFGSVYLGIACAQNAWEASIYLLIHFVLVFYSDFELWNIHLMFLVISDAFMLYAAWMRSSLIGALSYVIAMSRLSTTVARKTTENTLRYLCDVVLTVGPDFMVQESCPELMALLGRSLVETQGRSFLDFVHDEDAKHFAEHMKTFTEDMSTSLQESQQSCLHSKGSYQLRLLDAYRQPVSVNVFHASFGGGDHESSSYLLGISETYGQRMDKRKQAKVVTEVGRNLTSDSRFTKPRDPDAIAASSVLMQPLLAQSEHSAV